MTEEDARKAIIQSKSAILELNKTNEEKIQRLRELHARHKKRRHTLAEWDTITSTDQDKLAKVVVSSRPSPSSCIYLRCQALIGHASEPTWGPIKAFLDAVDQIRELKEHEESTIAEVIAAGEPILEELRAADPDQTVLSLRSADNLDESDLMAAWIKIANLGKKKEKTTREVEESGPEVEA